MRKLLNFSALKSIRSALRNASDQRRYVPVKLVTEVFVPEGGENKKLNPIIYHHGLTASKELWHVIPQVIANATKRLSYTFDARCHGHTEWTEEFSYDLTVEDLRYFMESMGFKKAIVVGHSMGGWTISTFALKYPHMVEMLVNEDSSLIHKVRAAAEPRILQYINLWQEGAKTAPRNITEAQAVKHTFDYVYERMPTTKGTEEKEFLYKYKYPLKLTTDGYDVKCDMDAIRKFMNEIIGNSQPRELHGIYEGPGLFMMGKLSGFYKEMDGEEVTKHFPNVEMQVLENVSHNIHLRFPEKFLNTFLEFYRRTYL